MSQKAEFWDAFADLYDSYYDDDLVPDDTGFYVELARDADGPVLEVGCGTGRIYLELLRAGVDAHGIDISRGMLEILRERAAERDLTPQTWQADMRSFDADTEYDLVIVPFRSFLHNISLADQKAALRRCRDALAPGGTLALDFFAPSFDVICEKYGEPDVRTVERDGAEYELRHLTEIEDPVEQVVRGTQTVLRGDEVVRELSYRISLVTKREFELLLETTQWSGWEVYGGFEYEPLEDDRQEMVWVIEK